MEDVLKSPVVDAERLWARFSNERNLTGRVAIVVAVVAFLFTVLPIVNSARAGFITMDMVRTVHLALALCLGFLMFPGAKRLGGRVSYWDYLLAAGGLYVGLYPLINYGALVQRAATGYQLIDLITSGIGIVLVLEATRRAINPAMVFVAVAFLLYAVFGSFLPGVFSHGGYSWKSIIEHIYLTKEGLFGIPLTVSAQFVILFIVFGSVFEMSGAGKFFMDFAIAFTGRQMGGPAKAAVVASALFGTISGSSVANVVTTGVFTIPLMKKAGYMPEFAGAVEPAASTGGQLMPPVMGAAAFVMAEFLGLSYGSIALAAVIPALLYFSGVYIAVDLQARKHGIRGLAREETPAIRKTLVGGWFYFMPIAAVIWFLATGYTPMLAVVYAMVVVIVIFVIKSLYDNTKAVGEQKKDAWRLLRDILSAIYKALQSGGKGAVPVALACTSAGIIVGVVTLTGIGFKLANVALTISGNYLLPILIMTMVTSLILGMGVPTTANYIITATVAAPAILTFNAASVGLNIRDFIVQYPQATMAAHMFAFYFGVAADLTPPVALAAYAGSAIARSDPIKTAANSVIIGIGTYIVPYMFIYYPVLLLVGVGFSPYSLLWLIGVMILTLVCMTAITAGTMGYFLGRCDIIARVGYIIAGIFMFMPPLSLKVSGLVIVTGVVIYQWWSRRGVVKR